MKINTELSKTPVEHFNLTPKHRDFVHNAIAGGYGIVVIAEMAVTAFAYSVADDLADAQEVVQRAAQCYRHALEIHIVEVHP